MQPALHPLLSDEAASVPNAEVAAVLADAIRDGRSGQMTRLAATFLAGVSAEFLLDRLALAGVAFVRRPGFARKDCAAAGPD